MSGFSSCRARACRYRGGTEMRRWPRGSWAFGDTRFPPALCVRMTNCRISSAPFSHRFRRKSPLRSLAMWPATGPGFCLVICFQPCSDQFDSSIEPIQFLSSYLAIVGARTRVCHFLASPQQPSVRESRAPARSVENDDCIPPDAGWTRSPGDEGFRCRRVPGGLPRNGPKTEETARPLSSASP